MRFFHPSRDLLRVAGQLGLFLLPWRLRRPLLAWAFGWKIHPTARIGLSLIRAKEVQLDEHARIGHFNLISRLDRLEMGPLAFIGRFNWIYAFPADDASDFTDQGPRQTHLILGPHAHFTTMHVVDCSERITIGAYTVVAGFRSTLLTHEPDFQVSRQRARPIEIGAFCFIGTGVIILGGVTLPDRTIVGAGAVINRSPAPHPGFVLAGVPARPVKELDQNLDYFNQAKRDEMDFRHVSG